MPYYTLYYKPSQYLIPWLSKPFHKGTSPTNRALPGQKGTVGLIGGGGFSIPPEREGSSAATLGIFMKLVLIFLLILTITSCMDKKSTNDKIATKTEKTEPISDKVLFPPGYINNPELYFHRDSIFNYLYIIKYYTGFRRDLKNDQPKLYTLHAIDTCIFLDVPLKDHINSRYTSNFYKSLMKTIPFYENYNAQKKNGRFYLRELIPVENNMVLGVFVENGHETIAYTYCKMELINDYYFTHGFYKNLDMTGIGGYYFDKICQLSDSSFYMIGHQKRESYQEVAIHYFDTDFKNYKLELSECHPPEIAFEKNEKLEYEFNKKDNSIIIKHLVIDEAMSPDWHVKRELNFDILNVINKNLKTPNPIL